MPDSGTIAHADISSLLEKFVEAEIDFIKVENLYEFNSKRGYFLAQGEWWIMVFCTISCV